MLSRSAYGLYWMSRYLERADHVSRLLAAQFQAIEDRPVQEIDQNWRRLHAALSSTPTAGFLHSDHDDDDFMLTDSFTLADELTFERINPDSLISCIENARENARQVRFVVGKQTWSLLNASYLELKDVGIQNIWNDEPRSFYLEIASGIRRLFGTMHSTMYRDHGWYFTQLGRYVERVQLVCSLIQAQLANTSVRKLYFAQDWYFVLQVCEASLALRRVRASAHHPDKIAAFLISDARLSHSVEYALLVIKQCLEAVSEGHRHPAKIAINEKVEQMIRQSDGVMLADGSTHGDVSEILREIQDSARQLNDDIDQAYLNYDVASYPGV
ncbi:MAG: alpha-E domain-containing protein [Acidiferrobacterales bacterium]|nr:alpha-E domain-containing protein [Acidiferrobacterales bacterium]